MRILPTLLTILFLPLPAVAETKWEEYLLYPSAENATEVESLEYSPNSIPENYEYWEPDLDILLNQVVAGDTESFKLAFRLLLQSDGGLAEEFTYILSRSIRTNARLFLYQMSELNPTDYRLRRILRMAGEEYVDRIDAQEYERSMRSNAISSISDSEIKEFREKCLDLLK